MSWEAWGDPEEIPECPYCEENHGIKEELAMLVKRLVRAIRKTVPDSDVAQKAVDYLKENDLEGPPIREDAP